LGFFLSLSLFLNFLCTFIRRDQQRLFLYTFFITIQLSLLLITLIFTSISIQLKLTLYTTLILLLNRIICYIFLTHRIFWLSIKFRKRIQLFNNIIYLILTLFTILKIHYTTAYRINFSYIL
jgi:hypothetical protein